MEHKDLITLLKGLRTQIEIHQAVIEMEKCIATLPKSKKDNIEPGLRVYKESSLRILDITQLDLTLSNAKYLVLRQQFKELKDILEIEDQIAKGEIPF